MVAPGGSDSAYVQDSDVQSYLDKGAEPGIRMTAPTGEKAIVPYSQQDTYQKKGATWDSHPDNDMFNKSFTRDDRTGSLVHNDYLTKTEDFIDNASSSVGHDIVNIGKLGFNLSPLSAVSDYIAARKSGKGIMDSIKIASQGNTQKKTMEGVANSVGTEASDALELGTSQNGVPGSGISVKDELRNLPAEYHAFEKARLEGKSITEAATAAKAAKDGRDQLVESLSSMVNDIKKNPGSATGHALIPVLLTAIGLGEVGGAEAGVGEAATEGAAEGAAEDTAVEAGASATPKPTLGSRIKQAVSPKAATQPGAQAALRGASGTEEGGIRTLLQKPIEDAATAERGLYDTANKAADTDMKELFDRREELRDALDDPTNIANRKALAKELDVTEKTIKVHTDEAASKGVDAAKVIGDAEKATQKRYAMEELDKKVFNNEGVVKGNVAHGAPETVDVDQAISAAEKLDKPSKFAPRDTPTRLVQAFGGDEAKAKAFKDGLYAAQKAGKKVLLRNEVIGALTGTGTVIGVGKAIFGH